MYISQQDAQSIVDEMKACIHRDINIIDENGVILASTNPVRQGQLHQGALRIIRENLPSLIIGEDNLKEGVQQGINLPIVLDGRIEGVIGITGDPNVVSAFGDVIKRMTEIMMESSRQWEQMRLTERAKGLFVENWLFSDEPDWVELEIRGQLLHLDINAPYTVALLKLKPSNTEKNARPEDLFEMRSSLILRMAQKQLKDNPNHFCTVVKNRVMVLLCCTNRNEAYSMINSICQDIESYYGLRIYAGISQETQKPVDIRRCYLEAKTAGAIAEQSANERVKFYDQVSLEFIAQSIPYSIKKDLRRLVFGGCTPQEQEDYSQVIRLYFEQDGNIQKCAEKMFIHRNTFQYRMDNIQKKVGYSLKVPKEAMLLYLAIQ